MVTKIIISLLFFIYLISCNIKEPLLNKLTFQDNLLYVAGSDFSSTGFLSAISLDDLTIYKELIPTHSDAVLKAQYPNLFIINRLGADNLIQINPKKSHSLLYQVSLGKRSNPHDLIQINQELWVILYGKTYIAILNSQTGSEIDRIDLSRWSDTDSLPEASKILLHENYVYVTIQRLLRNEKWTIAGKSYLLKIDTQDHSKIQAFELPYPNPSSLRYIPSREHLWIACPRNYGRYYELDGGICVFDLKTEQFLEPPLTEVQINIDISDAILLSNTSALVSGFKQNFRSVIAVYDINTKQIIKKLAVLEPKQGAYFPDMLVHNHRIYIADRNPKSPGIRIFNSDTLEEITEKPIDVGLPPFSLQILTQ